MSIVARTRWVVIAAVLAMLFVVMAPAGAGAATPGPEATYRVTVENLTENQTLTPAVVATHRGKHRVFRDGKAASPGLQQLAENGGVPVLAAELTGARHVSAPAVTPGPIAPGDSVAVLVEAGRGAKRLSLAAMLICTNDGFAGVDSVKVPKKVGAAVTVDGYAYDAGTEMNTEAYADLVPPCDGSGGSGMSNPLLAENGVVHRHGGITGIADLTVADHGWEDPVIRVTVERVAVYEVTVTNLTTGQPLTPAVVATHRGKHRVFREGRPASPGLQQLAENGGVPVLAAELAATASIGTVAVVGGGPIMPGTSMTATVIVDERSNRLSLAAMLVCSNDGFAGLDGAKLPKKVGSSMTHLAAAFDAGTEANTEAYADLVPPCDGSGGSGTSDPLLAENGVVHPHGGITGIADLVPAVHGWDGPVAEVTITRTG